MDLVAGVFLVFLLMAVMVLFANIFLYLITYTLIGKLLMVATIAIIIFMIVLLIFE